MEKNNNKLRIRIVYNKILRLVKKFAKNVKYIGRRYIRMYIVYTWLSWESIE